MQTSTLSSPADAFNRPHSLPSSVSASIVIFRTDLTRIHNLIEELFRQGVSRVYVIDNTVKTTAHLNLCFIDSNIIYIRTGRNVGYGRAHNIAIHDSVGKFEYHIVLNPDITLEAGVLAGLVDVANSHAGYGLFMPHVKLTTGETQYLCKRLPTPFDLVIRRFAPHSWFTSRRRRLEMRDHDYSKPMSPPYLSGCFMFFRVRALHTLGGFDERFFMYFEDLDLSRRCYERFGNLYCPNVSVMHGYGAGSYQSVRLLFHHMVSAFKYFRKWGTKTRNNLTLNAIRR